MLTIKQTADKLGVHWQTVRNHIQSGNLKSYKIGKLIKIDEKDLEEFIRNSGSDVDTTKDITKEENNIEYEIRYKLRDLFKIESKLLQIGAKVSSHNHIIDHWFIPSNIKSRDQHDIWFDVKAGTTIRIREQHDSYSKKVITTLDTKKLTKERNHNSMIETSINVENYQDVKKFLEMIDRKEFLTIDKTRLLYRYKDFQIEIDDIKGYGAGISIEIKNQIDRKIALGKLKRFAKKIELQDSDLLEKSVTVLAMDKLARFD